MGTRPGTPYTEPMNPDDRTNARAAEATPEKPLEDLDTELDFAKLDLSVQKVEERISPSETNVFDK